MLVADADRERHGDDAARQRGPEPVDERLVAVEEDDQPVAPPGAELLQAAQDAERTPPQFPVGDLALGPVSLDVGDAPVRAGVELQQFDQGLGFDHDDSIEPGG